MKCPCCKYEQSDGEFKYQPVTKLKKSGKNKGQEYTIMEETWVDPIGDESFKQLSMIENMSSYAGIDLVRVNICPKCGVIFKELL